MPDLYFNPYPGAVTDIETGKQILVKTALAVEALRNSIGTGFDPNGDCPVSSFTLVRDSGFNCNLNISDLFPLIGGRDRTVVSRLYLLFSKGQVLSKEMLAEYDKLTFKALAIPTPVLEFAIIHDGMTSSFATEKIWESDFLEFDETDSLLPNIWGQDDLSHIMSWIEGWFKRNNGYIEELKRKFNLDICKGALKSEDLSSQEWDIISEKLTEAKERNFEVDGYMIKDVETTQLGAMKQIKQKGSGLRLYLSLSGDRIIVGGYYRKGNGSSEKREKIIQSKAIDQAKKRIDRYCDGLKTEVFQ